MTVPATQDPARACAQRDNIARRVWINQGRKFKNPDLLHLFRFIVLLINDYYMFQDFQNIAAAVEIPVDVLLIPISTASTNNIISFHIFFIY